MRVAFLLLSSPSSDLFGMRQEVVDGVLVQVCGYSLEDFRRLGGPSGLSPVSPARTVTTWALQMDEATPHPG